ncbi:nicotinamide mononucleotide transporter [Undibacterium sp. LX40W]|uniref:Nicotinamide riboside transporter PnuC n=1 Tax=Undibacterium nitidum TaxID=2762298 RepID=A0A923HLL4_9BURK|nr:MULTISPECIES: nicotinamide riboside transporter PnuC [Undibacterium]MBC3879863.1 nicotinamide mononucleotide transporter [Undibacterium nitidum]MBC3891401.1 nicotinamide mononucleotide transporter [Undibacterium sp. LX40W]
MNQIIPLFYGLSTTPLELLSFVLSIITVACNIRQIHWGWLFAILSSGLYALVFRDAKLYGDMGLQFVFIAVSCWGWWQWLKGDLGTHTEITSGELAFPQLRPSRLNRLETLWSVSFWGVSFLMLYFFLHRFTDTDVPLADGFLTAGSLLGQILISRKKLENWWVWIVVDILYVALYLYKGLHLTAFLYGIFVVMAVAGARAWSNEILKNEGSR